jgi:hypothetical protein
MANISKPRRKATPLEVSTVSFIPVCGRSVDNIRRKTAFPARKILLPPANDCGPRLKLSCDGNLFLARLDRSLIRLVLSGECLRREVARKTPSAGFIAQLARFRHTGISRSAESLFQQALLE